jgi:sulfite reductase alpha subunit-like flavoprotein
MGREVKDTLVQLISSEGGKSEAAASELVKKLQTSKRYVQELWES